MPIVWVLGIGLTLLATCLITTVTSQNDSKISAITTSIKETIDKSLEEGRRENDKEVLFVMLASFILIAKIQEYIYKSNNELINNINNGASNMTTSGTSAIINNTQNIVNEALRENNTKSDFVAKQGTTGSTIIDFPTEKQEGPLVLPFPAQVVDKGPNITVFPEYTSEAPTILDTPATVKEEPYVEVFPREEPKSMEDMILWSESGRETKAFDIVEYGEKTSGLENHHGVLDVWATHNIDGYKSRASKSTTIALTPEQHSATKSVYRDWLYERTGKKVGGKVDWTSVSPQEIQALSEKMFDAANVPLSARNDYYREFNRYIYGLGN